MTLTEIKRIYAIIIEGLGIDLSITSATAIIEQVEEVSDMEALTKQLLLLTKLSEYASIIQGYSKEQEKRTKSPEAYGLAVGTEQLNRAIRTKIEALRTVLSNHREQLKMR